MEDDPDKFIDEEKSFDNDVKPLNIDDLARILPQIFNPEIKAEFTSKENPDIAQKVMYEIEKLHK